MSRATRRVRYRARVTLAATPGISLAGPTAVLSVAAIRVQEKHHIWWVHMRADPCVYCSGPADSWDHLEPRHTKHPTRGYERARSCARCNRKKGHKSLLRFLLSRSPLPSPPSPEGT